MRQADKRRAQPAKTGTCTVWGVTLALVLLLALGTWGLVALGQPEVSPGGAAAKGLLSAQLVGPVAVLYGVALGVGLVALYRRRWKAAVWYATLAPTGLAAGLVLAIPYQAAQTLGGFVWGMSNLYEVSVLLLAVTGTLALGFDRAYAPGRLLPFVLPVLALGGVFSAWLVAVGAATPLELVPALRNNILPLHVAANFVGYGCFAVAAGGGVAMLVRARADARGKTSRLPEARVLEGLAYRAVAVGFPCFSVAILLGCVWAYQAWGGYWSWDPKETWALIVWLVYAGYLHARAGGRAGPVALGWWLVVGFGATLFCYLGVNMFLSGLHSYGSLAA